MNTYLLIAAGISTFVGVMHSFLGERFILPKVLPLISRHLQPGGRYTHDLIRYVWHLSSIAWIGLGVQLWLFAGMSPAEAARPAAVVAGILGATGLVVLVVFRGRHVAWPLLFVATACIVIGITT